MKAGRGVLRMLFGALVLASAGVGCSVIVSSELPVFACTPGVAGACPSGLTCDATTKRCVAELDGAIPVEASDDGGDEDVTDGGSGDADAGPLPVGSPCRVNGDCASKICGTSTILTTAITNGPGPICVTPCCKSSECPSGTVCFNGGTGGGYCVPATLAKRNPPPTGGAAPGTTCTRDADCRSGLCEVPDSGASRRCIDTCCGDSDCADTTVCRIRRVEMPPPFRDLWVCSLPSATGTKTAGLACNDLGESCRSDLCLPQGGGNCRPSCASTAACRALGGVFSPAGRCVYGVSGTDYFKYCQQNAGGATGAIGSACASPGDCISGYCDAESNKCAEVCARDQDCASNEVCKPSGVTTPFLRCVKKN